MRHYWMQPGAGKPLQMITRGYARNVLNLCREQKREVETERLPSGSRKLMVEISEFNETIAIVVESYTLFDRWAAKLNAMAF